MTDAQWDLMDALWTAKRATARELQESLSEKRGWAYSTVKTQLDRLAVQGLVEARKVGHVWEYRAALSREQARRTAWERFVSVVFSGGALPALAFAAQQESLSPEERQALLDLIEESQE